MRFARKIIDSNILNQIMELPLELQNKKVEILILPVNEEKSYRSKFNPREFMGLLRLDNPEKDIQEIRNDWERM